MRKFQNVLLFSSLTRSPNANQSESSRAVQSQVLVSGLNPPLPLLIARMDQFGTEYFSWD